jgi:Zn finger protein HypA/HybF involved in hydrogenase expression
MITQSLARDYISSQLMLMHEFGSVQEAIKKLGQLRPAPRRVRIRLGRMRGSAKGFEEMFREHTRETGFEGIGLEVESVPVEISCSCGLSGLVRVMEHVHFVRCPKCGQVADVVRGNELEIEALE